MAAVLCLLSVGAWAAATPSKPAATGQTSGCLIEPHRVADVGAQVVGVVERFTVQRGDRVGAGQTVAELQSDVERANARVARTRARDDAEVRVAEANLELARQKFDRSQALVRQQFISDQALEQARAELDVASQRLAQARGQQQIWLDEKGVADAQLGLRTVRSPIRGLVADIYIHPGERVEERPLLRIAEIDPLRVELMVPIAHWGTVKKGDVLNVRPELPGAPTVAATVTHVDTLTDAASNTFRVQLTLPNRDQRLPAGLRCKADLPAG